MRPNGPHAYGFPEDRAIDRQRPAVVRYLLIHELVHTMHMNHSRRFWQRVARHCPDYESLDRELLDGWRRVPSWVFGDD